jgi:hypothetical protein
MSGGETVPDALVAVVVSVVYVSQDPQAPSGSPSLYWISYPCMELPAPDAAPDHDSVAVPSTTEAETDTFVGAVQAVTEQRMAFETFSAE